MAKTRNGVKKSKSHHQPYSKRTSGSYNEDPTAFGKSQDPDPEYIPSSSSRRKSLVTINHDNDGNESVSRNLRKRTLAQRDRRRSNSEDEDQVRPENENLNSDQNDQVPSPISPIGLQISEPSNSVFENSNPAPESNDTTTTNNSSSSRRSKRRRRRTSQDTTNPANSTSNNDSTTVPEFQNHNAENNNNNTSETRSSELHITQNSQQNHSVQYPPDSTQNYASNRSLQISTQDQAEETQNSVESEQTSSESNNSSLSPYQRVTRNLYRTGAVNDPDIELDVFEEYARIRMGTMNMTVSMKENQTVVFRFDSNPGLNFWSNSDTHPPIQEVSPHSFPDLLPLPRPVEHKIKELANSCESNNPPTFGINDLNRIFNELQDISDSHPVALIMLSILEALENIPPTGQIEDIANVIPDIQQAFERKLLRSEKEKMDDSGSIVDFDENGKILNSSENEDDCGDNCSICLSGLVTQFPLAQLKVCKHVFHSECLKSWHTVKYTCPLCRSHLSPLKVKLEYRMHSI